MNETEWAAYIEQSRERSDRLMARIAAGEPEAEAAHAEGFLTRNDLNAKLAAVFAARKGR